MRFLQALRLFIHSTLNAPRALIVQIQRVGTHTMWRVQASITLFSRTILSENSAPVMSVLRARRACSWLRKGLREKPSALS